MEREIEDDGRGADGWLPPLDIVETSDAVVVTADIPGLGPEDLEITVDHDRFSIRGERRPEGQAWGQRSHRAERRFGFFRRTLTLPAAVESRRAGVVSRNGVLTITLPKCKETEREPAAARSAWTHAPVAGGEGGHGARPSPLPTPAPRKDWT